MPRSLDLTALRSFVAVADTGGVTRASSFLHLTQSAVSMQVKRLEDALGLRLLERAGRGVVLTAAGEQLLGYARRMVSLNDEAFSRLTHQDFQGEVGLGVPARHRLSGDPAGAQALRGRLAADARAPGVERHAHAAPRCTRRAGSTSTSRPRTGWSRAGAC